MNFNFVPSVDRYLFNTTRGAWQAQLEEFSENTSQTFYSAGLEYLERAINAYGGVFSPDGGGCVCAVIEDGNEHASALIVVSHARARSDDAFLKMLNVYVQPSLNLADVSPNLAELAWIAATSIIGCLGMTYEQYPSRQLKIHTGVPLDKEFLTAVTTAMLGNKDFEENYEVDGHGTWIVVTKK